MRPDRPLWRLSAVELGPLLAAGAVTPQELLAVAHERIEALNPRLNAIVAVDAKAREAALESARRLAAGQPRSPLEGIPLTVKDNILVQGLPATWGSRVFADFVPDRDELPVARLRAAGAVILGKTNVPEFTLEGYTDNLLFGVTRNPWDPALTPGGSSGGAVASVAAGITALAIGTDGGGSIRRPASHTGLVGFKPSTGSVARGHGFPQILLDLEAVGPIARTVADAALLYRAMAGPDRADRKSLFARPHAAKEPAALRIHYTARFADAPLDPEIEASVAAAAQVFEDLGHTVTRGELPFAIDEIQAAWPEIGQVALAYLMRRYPRVEQLAAPRLVELARRGAGISADRYLAIIEALDGFRRRVAAAYQALDIVMTPSAAAVAWPAAQPYPPVIAGQATGPRGHAVYTAWVNACGHPGINLPCTTSSAGLPIGFQLIGDFGADESLLALAEQYEAAVPWASRWPPLAG